MKPMANERFSSSLASQSKRAPEGTWEKTNAVPDISGNFSMPVTTKSSIWSLTWSFCDVSAVMERSLNSRVILAYYIG